MNNKQPINETLRQIRHTKGFSLGDLSKLTGLMPSYLSSVELGRHVPSIKTLDKLASAYGIETYQFLYSGTPTAPEIVPVVKESIHTKLDSLEESNKTIIRTLVDRLLENQIMSVDNYLRPTLKVVDGRPVVEYKHAEEVKSE